MCAYKSRITYACGGHFGTQRTAFKVLESGFYWPTLFRDARAFCLTCDRCQKTGNLSQRDQMPQTPILLVEIFDVWGIDFMGPFPIYFGFTYILLQSIMCQSGWKLKPPELTILELLHIL